MQLPPFNVLNLLKLLFRLVKCSLLLLLTEGVLVILFFLHDGGFEFVLFGISSPSGNHLTGFCVMFHTGFFSLLDVLFLGESLPFCHGLFLRKLETTREHDSALRETQEEFGLGEVVDLLLLWKRFQKSDFVPLGFNGFRKDELDILDHGVSDVGDCLLLVLTQWHGIGVVQGHGAEIDFSVSFLHFAIGINFIIVKC